MPLHRITRENGTAIKAPVDVPTNPDGREYVYSCIVSVFCDAEADTHSSTCERVNDHARAEFYADVVRDDLRAML